MNTEIVDQKKVNLNFFYVVTAFFLGIILFLFVFSDQTYASDGYGWAQIISRGELGTNACGFPNDSDIHFYLYRLPYAFLLIKGDITVTSRSTGMSSSVINSFYVNRDCWDPNSAMFYDVTNVPGYRSAWGGIDGSGDPGMWRGRDVFFGFWVVPIGAGFCSAYCPTVQNTSPAGGVWFADNPTTFQVRNRLLPGSGSSSIIRQNLEILCSSSDCIGFNGGTDLATSRWDGYLNGSWAANTSSMTSRNLNVSSFSPAIPAMPTGRYVWFNFHQDNNNFVSANSGGEYFGIDRVNPVYANAFHRKPGFSCASGTTPIIYDDETYKICAEGRDEHSGTQSIVIWAKVTQSAAVPVYNLFTDLYHSCTNPTLDDTSTFPCYSGPYRASPPAFDPATGLQNYVHYRACVIDQVGHSGCDDGYFNPEIVEPWIETFDGDIGSRSGINQKRDLLDPDALPLGASPYTASYIISTGNTTQTNVVSWRRWRPTNYNINMAKFPEPIGSSIYDGLWQKYSTRCRGGPRLISPASFTTGSLAGEVAAAEASKGCRILEVDGVVDIDDNSWSGSPYVGKPAVIFVPDYDGFGISMTIRRNMVIASQTGIIFVTKGSINVCKNFACDNSAISPVTSISGFYVSDGPMYTDISGTSIPADPRLTINGSVISLPAGLDWRRRDGGYGRSMTSALNRNFSSEQIRYQPKYLWLFRQELGDVRTITQEIAP